MIRNVAYATLAAAALITIDSVPGAAQDREGRIDSTVNRVETNRRLQQYKDEQPTVVVVPQTTPSERVTSPKSRPAARVTTRSAAPAADGAERKVAPAVERTAAPSEARPRRPAATRTTAPVVREVAPKRILPRD